MKYWKKYKEYLPFCVLLFLCLWRYDTDYWHSKWSVTLAAASLVIAYYVGRNLRSIFAGVWTAWTLLMGLWVFSWRDNYYAKFEVPMICTFDLEQRLPTTFFDTKTPTLRVFESVSAYSTVSFLMLGTALILMNRTIREKIETALGHLCLISSCLVLYHAAKGAMHSMSTGGFFDQGSMEGCFIAITYPFLNFKPSVEENPKKWKAVYVLASTFLPIIAILVLSSLGGASQPFGVFTLMWITVFFLRANVSFSKKVWWVCLFAFFAVSLGLFLNHSLFDSSARIVTYKMALRWIKKAWGPVTYFMGEGTGTWQMWGPLLQRQDRVNPGSYFHFMHSDILQTFFEQGIVAFTAMIGVGVQAFLRAKNSKDWWLAVSLVTYAGTMIFNFPFHLPIHAFLGLFILVSCLKSDLLWTGTNER